MINKMASFYSSIGVLRERTLVPPCCGTFRLPPGVVEWCSNSTCPFYSKPETVAKQQQSECGMRYHKHEPL